MSNDIVDFPDRTAIDVEAAEWLIRLDGDRALPSDERAALKAWTGRSAVHRAALVDLARLWGRMNVLTALRVPLGEVPRRRRIRRAVRRVALASGTAAAVVGAAVVLIYRLLGTVDPWTETNGLYATAIGQQQEIVLPDSSRVHLNTNSQIAVAYSEATRQIQLLQGEAHFTVTSNDAIPFRVQAGNGWVEAVGTAFAVHLSESGVDVTVTEGKVRLARTESGSAALLPSQVPVETSQTVTPVQQADLGLLEAGQRGVIAPGNGNPEDRVSIDVVDAGRHLAWREGTLMFNGEPLDAVVREISRYTTLRIEIADPAIQRLPVGGRFPIGKTEAMFDALELNFGLHVSRPSPDRVVISAAAD